MGLAVAGAILCVIAIAMVAIAEKDYRARQAWCDQAAKAEGRVGRIGRRGWYSRNPPTSDDDKVSAVPVVVFKAANGVEYEFDAPDAPPNAGDPVTVAYDPLSPSTARVTPQRRKFGCGIVILAIGVALVVWGML